MLQHSLAAVIRLSQWNPQASFAAKGNAYMEHCQSTGWTTIFPSWTCCGEQSAGSTSSFSQQFGCT